MLKLYDLSTTGICVATALSAGASCTTVAPAADHSILQTLMIGLKIYYLVCNYPNCMQFNSALVKVLFHFGNLI